METKRIAIPSVLETRDETLLKDGLLTNCYAEEGPTEKCVVKRPGLELLGTLPGECIGQGAYYFVDGPIYIKCDTLHTTTGTPPPDPIDPVEAACPAVWNYGNLGPNAGVHGLAWNGTVFCAAGNYGVGTSPTGEVWNQNQTEFTPYVIHSEIVWNGLLFCTIGWDEPGTLATLNTRTYTSPTGHPGSWTAHYLAGPEAFIPSTFVMCNLGPTICAISTSSAGSVCMTTTLGSSWTVGTMPANGGWSSVAAGNGVFVSPRSAMAVAAVSLNGLHWTLVDMPFAAIWSGVAFNGEYFCTVSRYLYPSSAPPKSAISYDGYTWIGATNPMSRWDVFHFQKVCWDPTTRRWYAAQQSGILVMSANGLDWTECSMNAWINIPNQGILSNGVNLCSIGGTSHSIDNWSAVYAPVNLITP